MAHGQIQYTGGVAEETVHYLSRDRSMGDETTRHGAQTSKATRILVVDDLPMIQALARSVLESAGHQVDTVSDGAQALAAMESNRYDLLLMDIDMPVMDGLTATRKIRSLESPGRRVPILSMTAHALPHELRKYEEAGIDAHLGKPLKATQLLAKLQPWLQRTVSGRVLIVDDLEMIRELARSFVVAAGHDADVVSDGAQAVEAVQAKHYDLVLMDIQMPVMDGIAATKHIRALEQTSRNVPIIAITTNDLIPLYEEAGMSGYLRKPLNRSHLVAALGEWLPSAGSRQDAAEAKAGTAAVFDVHAFEELVAVVGGARVRGWAVKFMEQLELLFLEPTAAAAEAENLGRECHALVSQAGLLGFPALASSLADLEQACSRGENLMSEFEKTATASRLACLRLREIVARTLGSSDEQPARVAAKTIKTEVARTREPE